MKLPQKLLFSLLLVLTLVLTMPGIALAAPLPKLVVGGTYTLEAGETLDEDLTVVGGTVTLKAGSTVNGNIFLIGGNMEIAGEVNGDVAATGGYLHLADTAAVNGTVSVAGASVDRDQGAEVTGGIQNETPGPLRVLPPRIWTPGPFWNWDWGFSASPFWKGLWFLAWVFVLSALAVLLMLFFQRPLERTTRTAVDQPLISGGLGLLTAIIAPFVLIFLILTICLIPVALLVLFLLGVMTAFGWVALGYEVGLRFARMLKREFAPPVTAGLGTFILSLVLGGVGFIPCVGWIIPTLVSLLGLGAVLLTRFGTQDYPGPEGTSVERLPMPPAPPAASEPPAADTESAPLPESTQTVFGEPHTQVGPPPEEGSKAE